MSRLGDVLVDIKPGFASRDDLDSGVFQFRMHNFTRESALNLTKRRRVNATSRQLEMQSVKAGDVLFNSTNSPELVGKSALIGDLDEPAVFSNHFMRLRPDPALLDPGYLAHFLRHQFARGVFRAMTKAWVNQATVGRDRLEDLDIPVPPLHEQRRISAILDHCDALRAKRRQILAHLDALPQSLFHEMFGDPVTNSRGWSTTKLADLGRLDRGVSKHRPRNDPALLGGAHPLIQTGDVARSGGYITTYTTTYSDLGLAQSKLWPAGTLCITIAANIAKTGILTFDACFPDSVVGFTSDAATTTFVQVWLRFLQATLEASAPQSAQRNINLAVLRNLEVPTPGASLLTEFATRVEQANRQRTAARRALAADDQLFASLQFRAFRGDL